MILKKVLVSFGLEQYTNSYGVVDTGGAIRITQIKDLLNTWFHKPLLGWGVGADSLNVIRSEVHGAYEMTYFAKLMQRGLVGIIIYIGMITWMFYKMFFFIRHNIYKLECLYIVVGLSCMLIANGTNPYLESFDKLIILFLPLFIINIHDCCFVLNCNKNEILRENAK